MKIEFFLCPFFQVLYDCIRELHNIKNFHIHSEVYWENIGDDIQNSMNGELNDADTEEHEDIVDAYSEELMYAQSTSPKFHRETILVSIYNQVEFTLLRYCSLFNQDVMKKNDNFAKLGNGFALGNVAAYLETVGSFNSASYIEEWQYLKKIKLIRNCLVHSNGMVVRHLDEIQAFCNETPNFSIRNSSILIFKGAIDDLINVMLSLFEKLTTEQDLFVKRYAEK